MLSPVVNCSPKSSTASLKSNIAMKDERLVCSSSFINIIGLIIYRTFTIVSVLKTTPGGLNTVAIGKVL